MCKTPSKLEELLMRKALQHESLENHMDVKEKLKLEKNIIKMDEKWNETLKAGHKLTNSPTWKEFDRKVKMLHFNTPSTIAKHGNTSELCWEGCGQVAELMYIFWDCPKLQDFWKKVQKETNQTMGIKLDPTLFILGKHISSLHLKLDSFLGKWSPVMQAMPDQV